MTHHANLNAAVCAAFDLPPGPPYATDIGAAWKIVRIMRVNHTFKLLAAVDEDCSVFFTNNDTNFAFNAKGHNAAQAVCEAALAALGIAVPVEEVHDGDA